jgi:hypothetical protein
MRFFPVFSLPGRENIGAIGILFRRDDHDAKHRSLCYRRPGTLLAGC